MVGGQDMKLKTLLLGSAAAFAVVGGAQAADLSVAEPVESVKICDTFGAGYWYIPGSDTCLKIGGNVEFDINLHDLSSTDGTHSSNYDFVTKMGLNFNAKSMTEVGILEGSVAFKGTYLGHSGSGAPAAVYLDGAYLKLGALKVGHFGSTFNPSADFVDMNEYKSGLADNNKLELSWAAAGFTQLAAGSSWGVDGQLDFALGASDKIRLNAAYGDAKFVGGDEGAATNDKWSAYASFQHMFSTTLAMDATYSVLSEPGEGMGWSAAADLVWTPYTNFQAKVRAGYVDGPDESPAWTAQISLKRSW